MVRSGTLVRLQLPTVTDRPERDIRGVNQHSGKQTLPGPDIQLQFRSPPGARYALPIAKAHIDYRPDMKPPPETT
jgi:hypothetical protein